MFVVWEGYHRRSDILAKHLGAVAYYIQYGQKGKLIQAPIRYVVQALRSWRLLRKERPDLILVQNPPIFSVLVVFLYAKWYRAQYIIDSHTGAFLSPKWRWSLGLHRNLSKKALITIVHNRSQEMIVKDWNCRYCVLGFTPGDYSFKETFPLSGQFNLAVISTFNADEPINVIFEAASHLPDVDFYITGNEKRIPRSLLIKRPKNCHLTGFLSYGQYVDLLRRSDAIIDLTTQNHTLLMGGFEAVSLGTPLITSDWPVLKEYFSLGTVHVLNTAEGVCRGVREVQSNYRTLKRDILRLQDMLQHEFEQTFEKLQNLITRSSANIR